MHVGKSKDFYGLNPSKQNESLYIFPPNARKRRNPAQCLIFSPLVTVKIRSESERVTVFKP
ncbi:hypothetical protein TH9_00700 [Thalassospira xiamenensis]|nr:hypothetical protein TH9_00700 [Thalassospira xiamenensis]